MPNDLPFDLRPSRRTVTMGLAAGVAAALLPWRAQALDTGTARALVVEAVAQVNRTINSGKSEGQMYADFERLFSRYADVPAIARTALGVAARSASRQEISAFTQAYQGYIARKYGKRFREFIGSEIKVIDARPMKSAVEVISTAYLRNENPFEVRWHVSDRSGRPAFFNIIIEGVNMLASERAEVGALLDRNRGSIPALTEQLRRAS
ncbi:phospholipid-binding protein MlaC [Cereibacter johrii]|uniref:Phospholipid transport system substrate-binding protein n=1 Tax=Cereibacter johrii TaxID=445629 RepID=A0ABX5J856_9RHOB|nr:ABC transporter substrate-binding protein [Cereibacter johrii]QCP86651.1 ABC transporter substrate-binding protein [Cereibacter sphaeroides]RDS97163.1 ABC transporter substrate-binding protein [Cereibacter sphaeroides f. sp. denitrificans]MEA5159668.1 ABC transporter substrate-binding protein [Cereibacter johrii]ODM45097.1 ABC transporter [Cereibacter johrii]PTM79361.1 phospholipid transport system substrate-binding protein [Cereibacter johrii]